MAEAVLTRRILLIAFAATLPVAAQTFSYTGGPQQFTAPSAGVYYITATGAGGGGSSFSNPPGAGAAVSGYVTLTANEKLDIYVGQQGATGATGGGGGGGTFVAVDNSGTPGTLLLAGGGGGGANRSDFESTKDAQTGTSGGNSGGAGGTAGSGGGAGTGNLGSGAGGGGGGGGYSGNGVSGPAGGSGGGGTGFATLTGGSAGSAGGAGGYGGGGGGANCGGGGGGGYSGGGGGGQAAPAGGCFQTSGGGGGSYANTVVVNPSFSVGNTGNGSVVIASVTGPAVQKSFNPTTVPQGGTSTLSIQITAPAGNSLSGLSFTDTLPTGLTLTGTPNLSNSCGGTVTAAANSSSIMLTGGSIATAGASCTVSVSVSGPPGTYNNSVSVSSDQGSGNSNTATLTVQAAPLVQKSFTPSTIGQGGTSTLSIQITAPASNSLSSLTFTDTLPTGLTVAGTPNLTSTCGGTATATADSSSVSLSGGSIATAGSSCTVSVSVNGPPGSYNNSVSVSSNQGTGTSNTATLTVLEAPTITKTFGATSLPVGESTTLTFSLSNPNTGTSLSGIGFSDTLPAGLMVATPNGLTGTCGGGTITAAAGSGTVSLSGATLAASGSCTFSVNVSGAHAGMQDNVTSAVTSTNGGTGLTASASIDVLAFLNEAGTGVEDAFQITYVSQLNNADSVINISNAGTSNTAGAIVPSVRSLADPAGGAGDLCVNIYVYAPDQQQVACCSCLVTHNELIYLNAGGPTESTSTSWGIPTSEGGNGVPGFLWNTTYGAGLYSFNSAVVKLVATNANGPNGCFNTPFVAGSSTPANITASRITPADLAPGMSVWTTHPHPNNGPTTPGPGGTALLPVNVTETEGQYKGLSFGELTGLTTLCNLIAQNSSGAGQCSCPTENHAGGFVEQR